MPGTEWRRGEEGAQEDLAPPMRPSVCSCEAAKCRAGTEATSSEGARADRNRRKGRKDGNQKLNQLPAPLAGVAGGRNFRPMRRSYALEGETGSHRLGDPTGLPASLGAGPCGLVLMHYHVGPPRLLQHGSDVRVPRFLFTRQHLLVFL